MTCLGYPTWNHLSYVVLLRWDIQPGITSLYKTFEKTLEILLPPYAFIWTLNKSSFFLTPSLEKFHLLKSYIPCRSFFQMELPIYLPFVTKSIDHGKTSNFYTLLIKHFLNPMNLIGIWTRVFRSFGKMWENLKKIYL